MATERQYKKVLKELDISFLEMQGIWNELIEIGHKTICYLANKQGLNWTDLATYQIKELPTLKEKTLKQRAELEEKEKERVEVMETVETLENYEEGSDFYYEHFDEIIFKKISDGEKLSEEELRSLVLDGNVIETEYGDKERWTRSARSIIFLCGKYFALNWQEGLTENQEHFFNEQPYEVELHEYEKTIVVKEWKRK